MFPIFFAVKTRFFDKYVILETHLEGGLRRTAHPWRDGIKSPSGDFFLGARPARRKHQKFSDHAERACATLSRGELFFVSFTRESNERKGSGNRDRFPVLEGRRSYGDSAEPRVPQAQRGEAERAVRFPFIRFAVVNAFPYPRIRTS